MKRIFLYIFVFTTLNAFGQNFLANPGFEEVNSCEEFGAKCAPEAWFRIPPADLSVTSKAARTPFQGQTSELVVIENMKQPIAYRVFLYSKLLCPLQEGKKYELTFFLNTLKIKDYKIELLLSENELISGQNNPIGIEPSLKITIENEMSFNKETNWRNMRAIYTATGNEKFITIGNFSRESQPVRKKHWSNKGGDIVFLIDNISLKPIDVNELLCENANTQKENLYAQDYRHTNFISVDHKHEEEPTPIERIDNFFEKPIESKEVDELPIEEDLGASPKIKSKTDDRKKLVFEVPFVAFDFDRTEIKDEYESLLNEFADQIQNFNPSRMEIIGHTDSMGSVSYNKSLSERRAKAVYDFLKLYPYIKILPCNISGKGETVPKASNDTIEGRKQNRRVEIIVYRK